MEKQITQELLRIIQSNHWEIKNFSVTKPANLEFGEYTSNIALVGAKQNHKSPQELAKLIVDAFDKKSLNIKEIQIVGPGFLNFFLSHDYYGKIVSTILKEGENFGQGQPVEDLINIEFVSANPTGFLHVAHARGAALGDSLANIISFSGKKVTREYYINDAGNQIDRLAISLYTRYQQLYDPSVELPEDSYVGVDIIWGAKELEKQIGNKWKNVPYEQIKDQIKAIGIKIMLDKIKIDLEAMGIRFDIWFSEKSLYDNKIIEEHLKTLKGTYKTVSYTHLTLPTTIGWCRSRWSPYH